MKEQEHYELWESADGFSHAEIKVLKPEGHWPAMVMLEGEFTSMLEDDARALADALNLAARTSEWLNEEHFGR